MSSCEQTAECPDSTCAQVVHPNAEMGSDRLVSATARNERPEQKEKVGTP